jgi:large subunit ribosomal protein L6
MSRIGNQPVTVIDGVQVQVMDGSVNVKGPQGELNVAVPRNIVVEAGDGVLVVKRENVVTISGADKQKVGQIANRIKAIRKPDPYKGKGIRYEGEQIKLKPGKKAKTA